MTTKNLFICFALAFACLQAEAVVKLSGVSGASNYNITTGTTPKVWGGRGGTGTGVTNCETGDTLTPCNGCAAATGPMICNRKRIYPTLRLRITFTSDTATGRPFIGKSGVSTPVEIETGSVTKGNTATLDVPWSVICPQLTTADSSCNVSSGTQASGEFVVGIDANNDGAFSTGDDTSTLSVVLLDPDPAYTAEFDSIDDCTTNAGLASPKPGLCAFLAYPGDEKIYAEDLEGGAGFPATAAGTIKYIHFYYQTTDFTTFVPGTSQYKEVQVDSTTTGAAELVDKIIDGLENLSPHYFRTSSVDEALNEMYFTSDAAITAECTTLSPVPPFDGSAMGSNLCPFAAIPDEVLGLLNKDVNCFIATAAFGSSLHPFVEDLRQFRNRFLNPFRAGRKFVNWYYSWSPRAANWLKHNDWAKPVAKAALVPLWLFTQSLVWWPLSILALLGLLVFRRVRA